MRKISYLNAPSYTDRTVTIKDFSSVTKCAYNTVPLQDGLAPERLSCEKIYNLPSSKVEKLYSVNNILFAYCQDGGLYKCDNGEWSIATNCSEQPVLARVMVDGDWKVLVSTKTSSVFLGSEGVEQVSIPHGNAYATFKYRLFVACDDGVRFSAPIDGSNFDYGLDKAGVLVTDSLYGKVIALVPLRSRLVVVCERAIYWIIVSNGTDGFTLIKQDVDVNIMHKSICVVDDVVYFISRGELCSYQTSGLAKLNVKFDFIKNQVLDGCYGVYGAICMPVQTQKGKSIYTYDMLNDKEYLFNDKYAVVENGFVLGDDGVYKIVAGSNGQEALWESIPLDLSAPYKKNLTRVSLRANGKVQVQVLGQNLARTFTLENGGVAKLNLSGYAFTVILRFNSEVTVQNLKFVYRIKEEK